LKSRILIRNPLESRIRIRNKKFRIPNIGLKNPVPIPRVLWIRNFLIRIRIRPFRVLDPDPTFSQVTVPPELPVWFLRPLKGLLKHNFQRILKISVSYNGQNYEINSFLMVFINIYIQFQILTQQKFRILTDPDPQHRLKSPKISSQYGTGYL
jgi:hypothetical protein